LHQARRFGASNFLETSDYTASPDLTGFANSYKENATTLIFELGSEAMSFLSPRGGNQFRVRMTEKTFSNRNGE
jgi:hypothetical protein